MKPLYQGKLDAFCAVYAVLNALRLTHAIRTSRARDIMNETLMGVAANPERFRAFLSQETDYADVVDSMLDALKKRMPLETTRPFAPGAKPGLNEVWSAIQDWIGPDAEKNLGKAVVFRFFKYALPGQPPLNRHWTTADFITGDNLHLFDCSHEAEAVLNIKKTKCVVSVEDIDTERLLYIQPDSLRFLRLPV
ncbi:MAG: hypothetical protein K2H64_03740 [Desulfovibrio sp.]|nr:hypothetical protein [Desulfovibrio sp.]